MRLHDVNSIDAANQFLLAFIQNYNRRFAVPPQHPQNAHRSVLHDTTELAQILSLHHTRILSKNLTCQFKHRQYQLQGQGQGYRLRGAAGTVCETFNGTVTIVHQRRSLAYRILAAGKPPIALDDKKSVSHTVDRAKTKQAKRPTYKPAPNHPWRQMTETAALNSVD